MLQLHSHVTTIQVNHKEIIGLFEMIWQSWASSSVDNVVQDATDWAKETSALVDTMNEKPVTQNRRRFKFLITAPTQLAIRRKPSPHEERTMKGMLYFR
jgi:hypothetical protein